MEKQLGLAHKLGGVDSLGISKVGHSVSQVDGVSDMTPACQFCGWRIQQRDNDPCSPWCQTLQFLLVYYWCPLSCLPQCWSSEGVNLSR